MPVAGNNVVRNPSLVEYGKFLELTNQTDYPAISVVRFQYPDASQAFSNSLSSAPLTSVDIYPKYAVLSHITNTDDIKVSLSAENINVNLADVETILNVISPNVADIKTNTNDIEVLLLRTNTLINSVSSLLGNQLGVNGIRFCQPSDGLVTDNFNAIQVVSACRFSNFGPSRDSRSITTGITNYELPQNFSLTTPITSFTLTYGAVIAYK